MNNNKHNFIGMDGFLWFYGVVEDRDDPYFIGRVRVRCLGHHTGDKTALPTKDLPWANVILPVTSAGISGIGQSPTGLVEGSHVFGFFRDGEARQEPVIMGSCPGYPAEYGDPTKGFYSPIKATDDPYAPHEGVMIKYEDENGKVKEKPGHLTEKNSNYPRHKNSPDTNQLAVMKKYNPDVHPSIVASNDFINKNFTGIGVCTIEPMAVASSFISRGSSSLFGIATDFITSAVSNVLGAKILSTVGSTLGGFTNVVNTVNTLPQKGIDFLKTNLNLGNTAIEKAIVENTQYAAGVVDTTFGFDKEFTVTELANSGLKRVGVDPVTKKINYAITSPTTLSLLGIDSAPVEQVQNYLNAKADPKAKLGDIVATVGVKPGLALLDTKEEQETNLEVVNRELRNQGGVASQTELIKVSNVEGLIGSLSENEHQTADVFPGYQVGDQGRALKVLSEVTEAGLSKLMNNFIAADKSSWSMPTIPTIGDKYSSTYPKRHVYATESGHHKLYDDTEGARTTEEYHASGTFTRIEDDGTKLDMIVSDHTTGIAGKTLTKISESQSVTLGTGYKLKVNDLKDSTNDAHFDIEIGEGANGRIQVNKGNFNINVLDGKVNITCTDGFDLLTPDGDINVIGKKITFNATEEFRVEAPKIYLN